MDDVSFREYIEIPPESGWTPSAFLNHMQRIWERSTVELDYSSHVIAKKTVVKYEKKVEFDVPDMPMPGFSQRKI